MQNEQNTKKFWKSLGEKYNTPEFAEKAEKEFQSSPLKEEADKSGLARRQFMKLMGASVALSTAACVRRPVQKIIPYSKRPAEVVPGIANYYASSFFDGREVLGVTVKTREGRPIHLEGSEAYPSSGQGLSVRASANILSLYDPDRVRNPIINSQDPKKRGNKLSIPRDWDSIDEKVAKQLKKGGMRFLTSGYASPTLSNLIERFTSSFGGSVAYWNPINMRTLMEAQRLCYGTSSVPKYRYDKAKMIVSVDGDFLGSHLNTTESNKLFSMGRKSESGMSRLVSFQSVPSLTSLNADDNYNMKSSQQLPVLLGLIHELAFVQGHGAGVASGLKSLTEPYAKIYLALNMTHDDFAAIAKGLWDNKGKSLVVAGGLQAQSADALSVQIAVNVLNSMLGNDGKTVLGRSGLKGYKGNDGQLKSLMEDMQAGKVKTLIVDNVNPMYNLPNSEEFKEALGKVEMIVSTANWMDETASLADVVAPAGHIMENWGDLEYEAGVTAIQQPTIQPLHNTRSLGDSLMKWSAAAGSALSNKENYYELLKNKWQTQLGGEKSWYEFLQKGFIGSANATESARSFNASAVSKIKPTIQESEIELSLYAKSTIYDGTMANVSWLHELPDPVTKVAWDNYLLISPQLADANKLRDGDMVNLKSAQYSMDLPVLVQPGQNPGQVAVAIGYGRKEGGDLQKGVGFDVSGFAQWEDDKLVYSGIPVEIKKLGKLYELAQTQEHHSMEGRDLAVETTEKNFKEHGDIGIHKHKIFSIWNGHKYEGHKWAMSIDLNSCTGCSSCVVSCQSENNVPVVGKKYILQGREMHWIRMDRYFFSGKEKSPSEN
ncbi:MAG: TAT-variant-translocated molybdopterin oxidoreductase [Bdellovibrionales bacterium]|nr:TAT-variant-translocated molybdopterin oxidoreductase [Bdellovibrionales bacterium]